MAVIYTPSQLQRIEAALEQQRMRELTITREANRPGEISSTTVRNGNDFINDPGNPFNGCQYAGPGTVYCGSDAAIAIPPQWDPREGGGNNGGAPATTTVAGPPDVVILPPAGIPGYVPAPGAPGRCFLDIPRSDEVLSESIENDGETTVDISGVRGLYLCTIQGLLAFSPLAGAEPTQAQYEQFSQLGNFLVTVTLRYNGTDVPGFTDVPLSSLAPSVGCCDDVALPVNCYVPDYGSLSIQVTGLAQLSDSDVFGDIALALRLRFSQRCKTQRGSCCCG